MCNVTDLDNCGISVELKSLDRIIHHSHKSRIIRRIIRLNREHSIDNLMLL